MNSKYINNSLVIVADDHNPSLVSDYFLIKSKMIQNIEEIIKNSLVLSPAYSQVHIKGGTQISLDPKKLNIISLNLGPQPYEMGKRYCESLKYIKGVAIGINFSVEVSDYDFANWFAQRNFSKEGICKEVKFIFKDRANVVFTFQKEDKAQLNFNFHYPLPPNTILGDIELDFVKEWNENQKLVSECLKAIPNQNKIN